jgi:hypothetical protein
MFLNKGILALLERNVIERCSLGSLCGNDGIQEAINADSGKTGGVWKNDAPLMQYI